MQSSQPVAGMELKHEGDRNPAVNQYDEGWPNNRSIFAYWRGKNLDSSDRIKPQLFQLALAKGVARGAPGAKLTQRKA